MTKKSINTVFLEDDLSVFKVLQGNRSVEDKRVNRIIKSIKAVGMIEAPIVCNERLEVIDGQGRLEACKRLGIAVPYVVIPGLGVEECVAMNINQQNWSTFDYIKSHADKGNLDYQRIFDFVETSGFNLSLSLRILLGFNNDTQKLDELKNGLTDCSEEQVCQAQEMAAYLHKFDNIKTNRRKEFCIAIIHCCDMEAVDKFSLEKKILQAPRAFENIANILDCIGVIEDVYNKRRREHVYIETEYLKILEGKVQVGKALLGQINKRG